uniref:BTB domain-containing protein n=1 Tax=Panagrolaimus superbus TaxID=310955 RepID=A0A914YCC6_9BILA
MFSNNNWKETTNGKMTIEGFSPEVVEIAINFFYDRVVKTSDLLTLPNAMTLLEFSNMYLVDDLKENTEKFLIGSINVANACELTNFSLKANAPGLEKTCFEFLTKCLKNATPIYKFDELDREFLIKLLKNGFYAISETS